MSATRSAKLRAFRRAISRHALSALRAREKTLSRDGDVPRLLNSAYVISSPAIVTVRAIATLAFDETLPCWRRI